MSETSGGDHPVGKSGHEATLGDDPKEAGAVTMQTADATQLPEARSGDKVAARRSALQTCLASLVHGCPVESPEKFMCIAEVEAVKAEWQRCRSKLLADACAAVSRLCLVADAFHKHLQKKIPIIFL